MLVLPQDFISSRKDVLGDDAEAAVAVVHQPIARMASEGGYAVRELYLERFVQLQRQNMVRQAHVMPGLAGDGWRYGPGFVRKFCVRHPPVMTAVACQDRIPRVRLNRALGRSHGAGSVREANLYLALEFSRLDTLWMAGNLGRESVLSAAVKYQRLAPSVVLLAAGIIHNAAAGGDDRAVNRGFQSLLISIDQSRPDAIL